MITNKINEGIKDKANSHFDGSIQASAIAIIITNVATINGDIAFLHLLKIIAPPTMIIYHIIAIPVHILSIVLSMHEPNLPSV